VVSGPRGSSGSPGARGSTTCTALRAPREGFGTPRRHPPTSTGWGAAPGWGEPLGAAGLRVALERVELETLGALEASPAALTGEGAQPRPPVAPHVPRQGGTLAAAVPADLAPGGARGGEGYPQTSHLGGQGGLRGTRRPRTWGGKGG